MQLTTTSTQERTVETLSAAVTAEMAAHYTLVYNSQGDTLPEDVVAALVRGDNVWETKGGEALSEWEREVQWTAARDAVDELAKEITQRWEREDSTDTHDADYSDLLDNEWSVSDEREAAIDTMRDRDNSTWFDDLVTQYGAVLLRVGIPGMDEDAGLSFTPMRIPELLELLGFEASGHNRTVAAEIIDNASPESTVVMGQAIIGVDLAAICALPVEGKVELRNPHVWLGSPFTGSGWCGDEPFHGTLTVDRADLRTDKDAFGYPWNEVVGGTSASYYAGEITSVSTDTPPNTEA